jgi:N-acetylneuraminate synthase/N,N'-diacetyllegionaminate synthase
MHLAKEMIDAAEEAGADAVKFQTFKAESLVSNGTPKVKYQESTTSPTQSHYKMIKSLELSYDNHFLLKDFCINKNIKFLSTPYDIESARFLNEDLDVEMFKTASADLVDYPLHEYIAESGKPSIVSVGMASLQEIEETLNIYKSQHHHDVILLHCVSNYPCTYESLNLLVLDTLREAFKLPVGYSDHSIGTEAAFLSIGLGARVIEKHFTLDKSFSGPDHLASSTPDEFRVLVDSVRKAEKILGSSIKTCQDEERQMAEVSRKSIVLKNDLFQGDILKKEDFVFLRPGTGIYPIFLNKILGKRLKNDLVKGTQLSWTHFAE